MKIYYLFCNKKYIIQNKFSWRKWSHLCNNIGEKAGIIENSATRFFVPYIYIYIYI